MTAVLEVRELTVAVGALPVVRGVDLTLRRGEVLGLVGESGTGKTLTALALMGLAPAGARVGGSVRLLGEELLGLPVRELARIRGRRIAMVFQDPLHAFTPVLRVGEQIAEALRIHQRPRPQRESARRRAVELLDFVGVPRPSWAARAYPHQLSGGMRQRAMIAMAMANSPDVLVADEPTSALDVTVQAQVLEALAAARRETGAALLLVTHDLGVVAGSADRVAVLYAGRIVETGPTEAVLTRPRMPYTLGLVGSVPRPDVRAPLTPIPGTAPVPGAVGPGCSFAPRCPLAEPECVASEIRLLGVDSPSRAGLAGFDAHEAACRRVPLVSRRTAAELFPPGGETVTGARDDGDADPVVPGERDAGSRGRPPSRAVPGELEPGMRQGRAPSVPDGEPPASRGRHARPAQDGRNPRPTEHPALPFLTWPPALPAPGHDTPPSRELPSTPGPLRPALPLPGRARPLFPDSPPPRPRSSSASPVSPSPTSLPAVGAVRSGRCVRWRRSTWRCAGRRPSRWSVSPGPASPRP